MNTERNELICMERSPALVSMKFAISFCTALILFQSGCKNNPVDAPIKNPREYTWTIDTIAYPGSFQTSMRDIWGSSSKDVYVVGHNDQNRGAMWHFDGSKWSDVKLSILQGGTIEGAMDLRALVGLRSNSVFAVGERIYSNPSPPPNFLDTSRIIHFNGLQWLEEPLSRSKGLWSISATRQDLLWCCGDGGALYKYEGGLWQKDSVQLSIPLGADYTLWDIKGNPLFDETYMLGYIHQNEFARTKYYFFTRRMGRWNLTDSLIVEPGHVEVKFGESGLWVSPEGTLYSYGSGIFRWTGSSWLKVLSPRAFVEKMIGTGEKNIFVVGDLGEILQYNGVDWYEFTNLGFADITYTCAWTDGSDVFFVGFTSSYPQKTIIIHGR
jgi:hypothetical protein